MAEKKVAATAPVAAPAPVATGKGNGMAVAALVLGIIAIVLCWAVWGGIVVGVLAIIFGAVGLGAAKTSGVGRGMAMTGLVLGIIAAALSVLWFFVIAALIASIFGGVIGGTGINGLNNLAQTLTAWTPAF